ncbi:serine/threonine protein kinase [Candidatus Sumerlaeota bacterium]|nr:serine/threonine protein kinase [Candidatus Sumerlaeota bacterium]
MEEKTLVSEESTPASGFLFREDYLLFGMLVRHGLCTPQSLEPLAKIQRERGKREPLIAILAESSNMQDKSRKDIEELLKILSTPELRKYLPNDLPDIQTIVSVMTQRESTEKHDRAGVTTVREGAVDKGDPHLAETVQGSSPPATSTGTTPLRTSTSYSFFGDLGESIDTALTETEKKRVETARSKGELIGKPLAGHILLDKLGTGGQGEVYLAKQLSLNRYVAMKRLYIPLDAYPEDFLNAFRIEAQTLGRINHARIVKVYEIFMDQGIAFFTMEHLNGKTLKELVVESGGAMRTDVVANLACQACSALSRTAEDGLVHRDIKPANMMVDENGDLKIVDFGLAGMINDFGMGEGFSGTPQYASPEQVKSEQLTPLSDMYSLGMTLYYCLTGELPLKAGNPKAMLRAQVDDVPKPPSFINTQLPREVDRVIMRMVEKDPKKRFKDFDECFNAWSRILAESNQSTASFAGTKQLLGEALLQFTKSERVDIMRRSIFLAVAWFCLAVGTLMGESALRNHNMDYVLKFCGDFGTYLLAFSLSCIFYVALARRGWLPIVGSLRVWLYVHISTAVPSVAMLLLHSGNWLRDITPGGSQAKPLLTILISSVLLVTAISGSVGLMIFRALRRQLQLRQMELRGAKSDPKQLMMQALSAQFLAGWRLVHYPLAVFFILMSVLHIMQSLKFMGG